MSLALVTGASSGIGLEISKMLLKNNFVVYGISRNKPNLDSIQHIPMNLLEISKLSRELEELVKKLKEIKVLVHCAGLGLFGLHEELNFLKLEEMLYLNFSVPILLTRLFLRNLKRNQGWVVFISSTTASRASSLASAYSATKAGLSHFSLSLWEETRKSGLRVVCLEPDITNSNFYRETWFEPDSNVEAYLEPKEIAEILENILHKRSSINILNVKIQPKFHRIKKK